LNVLEAESGVNRFAGTSEITVVVVAPGSGTIPGAPAAKVVAGGCVEVVACRP